MPQCKQSTIMGLNDDSSVHLRAVSYVIMDDACQHIVRLPPSLDLMMSQARLHLDSSYRTLSGQLLLRVNARTDIQASVAWNKLTPMERERDQGGLSKTQKKKKKQIRNETCSKKSSTFHATLALQAVAIRKAINNNKKRIIHE